MAVPFDRERLEIAGDPSTVLANVATQTGVAGINLAVSNKGTLIFVEESREDQLVWVDADGTERPAATEKGIIEFPRVSPDGTRAALVVRDGVKRNIRLVDLTRGAVTRLTYGNGDTYPAWSPDGAWIYFSSGANGPLEMFRVPSDGSEAPQLVLGGQFDKEVSSLSPDGRWLAFVEDKPNEFDLSLVSLESGEIRPFASSPFYESSPAFSPDGEWVAYDSNESGRFEVYLRRSDGRGGKIQVSTEGGECPVWSRTKSEIYFWSQSRVVSVTIPSDPTSGLGRPVVLFRGDPYRGPGAVAGFDVGPSGEFLMVRTQSGAERTEINVVLNWFEELRRLAPRN
jgi:Tol biopolymer transport system component